MCLFCIYYKGVAVYSVRYSDGSAILRHTLSDIATSHIKALCSEFPEFKKRLSVSSHPLESKCGDILASLDAIRWMNESVEPELRMTLALIQRSVGKILADWQISLQDPWIKEHIDKPHDGYYEERAGRYGYE